MNKLLSIGATTATILAVTAASTGTALAWHPKGDINKSVQNLTQNSKWADADTAAAAVAAKPGDILLYQIDVTNNGAVVKDDNNDMAFVVMTDKLPAGLELVSDASKREIKEDLGTIAPGKTVSKQYKVKVTSTKDGDVITNQACYTGDSAVKDSPQKGCDTAVVKVNVPKVETPVTETPKTPEAPQTGKTVEVPAEMPKTGVSSIALIGTGLTALAGYAAFIFRARRVNG